MSYKTGRGRQVKFCHYRKGEGGGGADNIFAMLKEGGGGIQGFEVVLTQGAKVLAILKGVQKVSIPLKLGGGGGAHTKFYPFLREGFLYIASILRIDMGDEGQLC